MFLRSLPFSCLLWLTALLLFADEWPIVVALIGGTVVYARKHRLAGENFWKKLLFIWTFPVGRLLVPWPDRTYTVSVGGEIAGTLHGSAIVNCWKTALFSADTALRQAAAIQHSLPKAIFTSLVCGPFVILSLNLILASVLGISSGLVSQAAHAVVAGQGSPLELARIFLPPFVLGMCWFGQNAYRESAHREMREMLCIEGEAQVSWRLESSNHS